MPTPEQRLLPDTRRAQLLELVRDAGAGRVSELAERLGVSPLTVRRDIALLASRGVLEQVHGGARATAPRTADSPTAPETATDARPAAVAHIATDRAVGMLVPSLDYYWPEVARGAQESARRNGMRFLLQGSSYSNSDERPQLRRLAQAGVDGLVVAPNLGTDRGTDVIDWLHEWGGPVVLAERTAELAPLRNAMESVTTDHVRGAAVAVRYLAQLGHRRVGVVVGDDSPTSVHVRAGWQQVGTEDPSLISHSVETSIPDRHSPGWQGAIDRIVEDCLSSGTTALLVHSDPEAMAIVERCETVGLSVPGDLSVIAYDDELAGLFQPALTAVQPSRHAVGVAALELLAARFSDPKRPIHQLVISPILHPRESTAPPSRATAAS